MADLEIRKQPATWRIVTAALLDFFTAFWVFGFAVGAVTGSLTGNGFQLDGWPALLFFVLVIAYFIVFNRFFNGTIWKHVLSAQR